MIAFSLGQALNSAVHGWHTLFYELIARPNCYATANVKIVRLFTAIKHASSSVNCFKQIVSFLFSCANWRVVRVNNLLSLLDNIIVDFHRQYARDAVERSSTGCYCLRGRCNGARKAYEKSNFI